MSTPNCPGGYIHCWECKEAKTCSTAAEIRKYQDEEERRLVRDVIGIKDTDSDFDAFWHILDWEYQEMEDAWAAQPTPEEYEQMMREDEEDGYPEF
jgi:hypothetical protein